MVMPKLVFSRKGFDSKAGHGYSPFDPITRNYIVLPIPEDNKKSKVKHLYRNLKLKKNWFEGIDADNLEELVLHKDLKYSQAAKQAVESAGAHFDPMLGSCPWLEKGPQICAFGQSEAARGHLRNQGVGEGSIFLFFSRFKPIRDVADPDNQAAGWEKGVYFLYGWMRVGKIFDASSKKQLPKNVWNEHPHGCLDRKNDATFMPAEKLFDDMDIRGLGLFLVAVGSTDAFIALPQESAACLAAPRIFP